jgi:glucokinase
MTTYTIGLDIGGTKITGILFDGKKIVRELTIVTPKNLAQFKKSLTKLTEFITYNHSVTGVGVGVAGIVNTKNSTVQYSPNMKFLAGFKFEKFFEAMGYKEIVVENDANCFAYAESVLGKGKGFSNFVGITLGTGVGAGLISNQNLYRGSHGSAGEAGHMMADFKYDTEYYFQAAKNKKDFKRVGEVVGILLANIINLLDIDGIVLGGTVSQKHHAQFLPIALKVARLHILNKQIKPKILISTLKDSGALGAALLAHRQK